MKKKVKKSLIPYDSSDALAVIFALKVEDFSQIFVFGCAVLEGTAGDLRKGCSTAWCFIVCLPVYHQTSDAEKLAVLVEVLLNLSQISIGKILGKYKSSCKFMD